MARARSKSRARARTNEIRNSISEIFNRIDIKQVGIIVSCDRISSVINYLGCS